MHVFHKANPAADWLVKYASINGVYMEHFADEKILSSDLSS